MTSQEPRPECPVLFEVQEKPKLLGMLNGTLAPIRFFGRGHFNGAPPDALWLWSITVIVRPRRGKKDGRAVSFEDAKTQFSAAWEALKAVSWKAPPGGPT
jgi:hypothetical protein